MFKQSDSINSDIATNRPMRGVNARKSYLLLRLKALVSFLHLHLKWLCSFQTAADIYTPL